MNDTRSTSTRARPNEATAGGTVPPADGAVAGLAGQVADVQQLLEENQGLVEEVLRIYEQLNLVFDVTAQVAVLSNSHQVKHLLCDRLRTSLNARAVWFAEHTLPASRCEPPRLRPPGPPPTTPDLAASVAAIIEAVRAEQKVLVRAADPPATGQGGIHLMAGPLRDREDNEPLVVCVIRARTPFTSGDMLLLDSILAYGGHVLRNLYLVQRLKRTSFETVRALVGAIDKKDPYTCGHSERVGILARMTGQELGLPPEQLQELEWAGLLHDIGKIGIPEAILNKPGSLTDEEYAVVKQHPQMSYDVLKPIESLAGAMRAVIEHHENFDGTGYPRGLRGEEISLMGRIMHVADVFDALTSSRSYRSAYDTRRALAIIRQDAGTKLDPTVAQSFCDVIDRLQRLRPAELDDLFTSKERP